MRLRLAGLVLALSAGLAMAQPAPSVELTQKKLAWEAREHQGCVDTLVNFVQQYEDAKKQIDDLQKQVKELQDKQPKEEEHK